MKSLYIKDKKQRLFFFRYELHQNILKFLRDSSRISLLVRLMSIQKLLKMTFFSFSSRIVNRCVVTNRSKGVFRLFKMSRILLRERIGTASIVGVSKSSW